MKIRIVLIAALLALSSPYACNAQNISRVNNFVEKEKEDLPQSRLYGQFFISLNPKKDGLFPGDGEIFVKDADPQFSTKDAKKEDSKSEVDELNSKIPPYHENPEFFTSRGFVVDPLEVPEALSLFKSKYERKKYESALCQFLLHSSNDYNGQYLSGFQGVIIEATKELQKYEEGGFCLALSIGHVCYDYSAYLFVRCIDQSGNTCFVPAEILAKGVSEFQDFSLIRFKPTFNVTRLEIETDKTISKSDVLAHFTLYPQTFSPEVSAAVPIQIAYDSTSERTALVSYKGVRRGDSGSPYVNPKTGKLISLVSQSTVKVFERPVNGKNYEIIKNPVRYGYLLPEESEIGCNIITDQATSFFAIDILNDAIAQIEAKDKAKEIVNQIVAEIKAKGSKTLRK